MLSAPAGFFSLRTTRVFLKYLPTVFRGRPVILNKRDMIDALSLEMNRVRQAAITMEIIEIVSGAAAL